MTPADRARQLATDATVIATLHDTARTMMQLGQPGLPEHTPGAGPASTAGDRECARKDCTLSAPCPLHDPDGGITLTATERLGTTPDAATRDLNALDEHCRQAAHHLAAAATLTIRWQPGITDTDVKTSLQERINAIWCVSCAKAGISTVRVQGRTECRFCEEVRQKGTCGVPNPNHFIAPKALLEIHARRRLNSADFIRCMTAAYGDNWNKKLKKGKAA